MLVKYKKEYEKTAMGLLSYLPDFKNLQNLQQEIELYNNPNNEFDLYLFGEDRQNFVGVVGLQFEKDTIVIRYLSLAPGFRNTHYQEAAIDDFKKTFRQSHLMAVPDYNFLLKGHNTHG